LDNEHFSFAKTEENKGSTGTSTKPRSNRYEQTDDVDHNDIDLEAHETLDIVTKTVPANEETKEEEGPVK
jgi:hypothetical protein